MSEKPFIATVESDSRKAPVRVAFITRRTSPHVKTADESHVLTWPEGIYRVATAVLAVSIVLVWMSLLWDAPLEGLADPMQTPNPAKAPWYFLGLQELVSYSAFWGGVVVPGVLVAALVLLPYVDGKRRGVGRWFARERLVANTIFTVCLVVAVVLTIIGTLFRGPNWSWQEPWKKPPTATEGH